MIGSFALDIPHSIKDIYYMYLDDKKEPIKVCKVTWKPRQKS